MGFIGFLRNMLPVKSVEERGPTGSRIKLVLRSEQWQRANDTAVDTSFLFTEKATTERSFRTGFLGHVVLLWSQGPDPGLKYLSRQSTQRNTTV